MRFRRLAAARRRDSARTLRRGLAFLGAALLAACAARAPAPVPPPVPPPDLIPREQLFGNPERTSPQLSPDGRRLGFLAPLDGVVNVWVAPVDRLDAAAPVTRWKERPVSQYFFAYDNAHLVYLQDKGGNENFHAYSIDLASGDETDLTPLKDIRAEIVEA